MAHKKANTGDEVEAAATVEAPAAERLMAIDWATALGHRLAVVSTEEARANPGYWKYDATKSLMGWDDRTEMTRAEYEAAVRKMDGARHG